MDQLAAMALANERLTAAVERQAEQLDVVLERLRVLEERGGPAGLGAREDAPGALTAPHTRREDGPLFPIKGYVPPITPVGPVEPARDAWPLRPLEDGGKEDGGAGERRGLFGRLFRRGR